MKSKILVVLLLFLSGCGFTETRKAYNSDCQEFEILKNKNRRFIQSNQKQMDDKILEFKEKCRLEQEGV